jgi:hypothetical protein
MRTGESKSKEEEIKARMMRNASRLWGQPNSSVDSFDPLVGMLIGASAVEVSKIYDELESSQSRILERLASQLTPEIKRGPSAAHAIMHARSTEPEVELSKEFQFYTQKKLPLREGAVREEYTQVYFTPSLNIKLFDAQLKFMVHDSKIVAMEGLNERGEALDGKLGKRLSSQLNQSASHPIYFGLELNKKVSSIDGLSFYFDWLFSPEKSKLYQSLVHTRWFVGDRELQVNVGLGSEKESSIKALRIGLENDLARIEEMEVTSIYKNRFVTVEKNGSLNEQDFSNYPKEFEEVFGKEDLKVFKDQLLWIRVEVANPRAEFMSDLICMVNCFPILCRHLNEFSYRLQSSVNIIPLKVDAEFFYSVCAVRGSDNNLYVQHASKAFAKSKLGTYLLRQGGIERFDKRDANELLHYLIDLLRDESASFAVYGNDIISSNLRELNQSLNNLVQKVDLAEIKDELITYLVVKPVVDSDNVFVEFWTTHGSFANSIRTSTVFSALSGFDIKSNSMQLITTTQGGKDTPDSAELLRGYRKALMTRGRIVTASDIELFIQAEDKNGYVAKIAVSRGLENSISKNQGLVRTIEVNIIPTKEGLEQDWDSICYDWEQKLKSASSAFFPITVKMKAS